MAFAHEATLAIEPHLFQHVAENSILVVGVIAVYFLCKKIIGF